MPRLNPLSTLWLWRGLSGHSVTFASLFASFILGFSISKGLHHLLGWMGFHWLYVLLIPILFFRVLAEAERHWIPDPARRRSIALGILLGSLALATSISWIRSREDANSRGVAGSRVSP